MRIRLSLFSLSLVVALVLGVGAGQADIYNTGEGSLTISSNTLAGFEKYKLEASPSYFAVANDGRGYGFTRCPPDYFSCSDDTGDRARKICDQKAKLRGAECFTFAIGSEVVWKGPVTYPGYGDDYLVLFTKIRPGSTTNYSGKGNSIDEGRKIALRVGECRGEADISTKKWHLKGCKDNYSAQGTFVAGSGGGKYYGVGRDSLGVSVKIKLLVPDSSGGKISKGKIQYSTIPASVGESAIDKYKAIVGKISYLGTPTHKAFVASEGGAYGYTYNQRGIFAAVARAFSHCMKRNNSSSSCRLYDLDGFALEGMESKEATSWAQNKAPAWLKEKAK